MSLSAPYPIQRFRRLRRTGALRSMVAETRLSAADFIWPIFVTDVPGADVEISSMPGIRRLTLDGAVRVAEEAAGLGIPAICLFPYTDPALKTESCEEAWSPENLSNRVIRAIKAAVPDDITSRPGRNFRVAGLGVDSVWMNIKRLHAVCGAILFGIVLISPLIGWIQAKQFRQKQPAIMPGWQFPRR